MSGVVLHTGSGSAVARTGGHSGSSLTTAGLTWSTPVISVDDLGPEAAKAAPSRGVLAECAVEIRGARRAGSSLVQTRLGFRAYSDRVVVLTGERQLAKRPDGKLAPIGPWQVTDIKLESVSAATRRTGIVEPGRLDVSAPGEQSGAGTAREHEPGVESVQYLPAQVRTGLAAVVPTPQFFIGELTQLTGGGKPPGQRVVALRSDSRCAAVVLAERDDRADAAWTVTEWRWSLGHDAKAIGGRR